MGRLGNTRPKRFAEKLRSNCAHNLFLRGNLFVIKMGIVLLGLAFLSETVSTEDHFSLAAVAKQADSRKFYQISGHPIKLFVYSQVPLDNFNSIVKRLIADDKDKILSPVPISEEFMGADAALFVIKSWDKIKELPNQEEMAGIYRIAQNTLPEAISTSFFVHENGKPMMMMFYISPYIKKSKTECISGAILEDLKIKPHIKSYGDTSNFVPCNR